jgi:hypothetical protein
VADTVRTGANACEFFHELPRAANIRADCWPAHRCSAASVVGLWDVLSAAGGNATVAARRRCRPGFDASGNLRAGRVNLANIE